MLGPTDDLPKVPLSREEIRLSVSLAVIAVPSCLLIVIPAGWLFNSQISALAGLLLSGAYLVAMTGLLALALRLRWPGALERRSEMKIAATPSQIWDTLRFDDKKQYYKPMVLKIERLDEQDEIYRLHYFSDRPCTRCGLHREPGTPSYYIRVEIIESIYHSRLRTRSVPSGFSKPWRWFALDYEEEQLDILDAGSGICRVAQQVRVIRPTIIFAAVFKLGDPVGQHLANLKAYLENGDNDTLWGTVPARIDAIRQAGKFCACAPCKP